MRQTISRMGMGMGMGMGVTVQEGGQGTIARRLGTCINLGMVGESTTGKGTAEIDEK